MDNYSNYHCYDDYEEDDYLENEEVVYFEDIYAD